MRADLRAIVEAEMPTATCARASTMCCNGRLTVEHPLGRKVQKRWLFIYLCWYHHLGPGLDKEINRHLVYQQVSEEELRETYPKTWQLHAQKKKHLIAKYGMDTALGHA